MLRRIIAVVVTIGSAAIAGGPLACVPAPPPPPNLPMPQMPKPPTLPPPPGMPAPKPAQCCFRDDRFTPTMCNGGSHCCTDADLSPCEDSGGLWFSTAEGCKGAC